MINILSFTQLYWLACGCTGSLLLSENTGLNPVTTIQDIYKHACHPLQTVLQNSHKRHYDLFFFVFTSSLLRENNKWMLPKMWLWEKKQHSCLPTSLSLVPLAWARSCGPQQTEASIISSLKMQKPRERATVMELIFAKLWNVGHLRDFGTPHPFTLRPIFLAMNQGKWSIHKDSFPRLSDFEIYYFGD